MVIDAEAQNDQLSADDLADHQTFFKLSLSDPGLYAFALNVLLLELQDLKSKREILKDDEELN